MSACQRGFERLSLTKPWGLEAGPQSGPWNRGGDKDCSRMERESLW